MHVYAEINQVKIDTESEFLESNNFLSWMILLEADKGVDNC